MLTYSFDPLLPTARDRIRSSIGDTAAPWLLADETIDAYLALYDEATATARIARSLASRFGRNPTSVSIPGGPSISYSARVSTWLDLAKSIEDAVGIGGTGSVYSEATAVREGMMPSDESEYHREIGDIPGWYS